MSPPLLTLPFVKDQPFGNMATDLCLLRAFGRPECPRLRHYGWAMPCHTFGFGQNIDWVARQTGEPLHSLCRRPTGGGVVDHRQDWTYALVIPSTHPFANRQMRDTYEALHKALAEALSDLGVETNSTCSALEEEREFPARPGHCFKEPVPFDLLSLSGGYKIAGAAIKKGREGLLLQGSVRKDLLPKVAWEKLLPFFSGHMAACLNTTFEEVAWPENWNEMREPFLHEIESVKWQRR